MMEVSLEAATLRALYAHSIKDLNLDQVPSSIIRRCLELVKTCYNDLEDLVTLRNGSPDILSSDPTYACRIDTVIADAQRGLVEVCELVPRLSSGTDRRKALKNRLEWMLVDSKEFASREQLVACQHRRVVAEIGNLRGMVAMSRLVVGDGQADSAGESVEAQEDRPAPRMDWENIDLLQDMLAGNRAVVNTAAGYRLPPLPDLPPPYDFKDFNPEGESKMASQGEVGNNTSRPSAESSLSAPIVASSTESQIEEGSSGLIKVEAPTTTAAAIDGMDLLFGPRSGSETHATTPAIDGFDMLLGNITLGEFTHPTRLPSARPSPLIQHDRPVSELSGSPFTPPPPITGNSTPSLQPSQVHHRHASLPAFLSPPTPSPQSPPKPLPTSPEGLRPRHDEFQPPNHRGTWPRPVPRSTYSQPIYLRDRASTTPSQWQQSAVHPSSSSQSLNAVASAPSRGEVYELSGGPVYRPYRPPAPS